MLLNANSVISRLLLALASCLLAACAPDKDKESNPAIIAPSVGAIAIAVSTNALSLAHGRASSVGIGVNRAGGYSGTVTLLAEGVPNGVTVYLSPSSVVPTATESAVVFAVGPTASPGTYNITVRARATDVADATAMMALTIPAVRTLTSGVAVTALSDTVDSEQYFRIPVPVGTSRLLVSSKEGTGDLDLAVRFGQLPSGLAADCLSDGTTNSESCEFTNPSAGDWYIRVRGYRAFSGASLTATVTGGSGADTPGFALTTSPASLSLNAGQSALLTVNATRTNGFAGAIDLSVEGLPAGVTVGSATVAAGATTASITLTALSSVAASSSVLTIRGRAAGSPDRTVAVPLTVTPTVGTSFSIALGSSSVSMRAGETALLTVSATRSGGLTSAIAITLEGLPAGVTASSATIAAGATAATVTLSAASGASTAVSNAIVRARVAGLTDQTIPVSVSVTAASATPGYRLALTPSTSSVTAGTTARYTVSISRDVGFVGVVQLSVSGLPGSATGDFTPAQLGATDGSSVLTVAVPASTSPGQSTFSVIGRSGALSESVTAQLVVTSAGTGSFTLSGMTSARMQQGGGESGDVVIVRSGGFQAPVSLRVEGLAAGISGSFDVPTLTGSVQSSALRLTASAAAAVGRSSATVRASAVGQSDRSYSLSIEVVAATDGRVARVEVTVEKSPVNVGDEAYFFARAFDAQGSPVFPRTLTWRSSNQAVASFWRQDVNGTGATFRAVGGGTTTVTVNADGREASVALTVFSPTTLSLTVSGLMFGSLWTNPTRTGYRTDEQVRIEPRRTSEWGYFAGWGGDCASVRNTSACTLQMDRNRAVLGSFSKQAWSGRIGGSGPVSRRVTGGTCTWDIFIGNGQVVFSGTPNGNSATVAVNISFNITAPRGRATGTAMCDSVDERLSADFTAIPDANSTFSVSGQMGTLAVRLRGSPDLGTSSNYQSATFSGRFTWTYSRTDGTSISGAGEYLWDAARMYR